MGGGGFITLAVLAVVGLLELAFYIVAAPLRLYGRAQQRRRNLSPHELALRRASHPLGFIAVAAGAAYLWPEFSAPLLPVISHPVANPAPAVVLGAAVAFGLVLAASGMSQAAGLRNWPLAARALFKLGLGAFTVWKIWQFEPWAAYGREWSALDVLRFALLVGVWLGVTGLIRLVLLVVPVRGARSVVVADIEAQEWDWNA